MLYSATFIHTFTQLRITWGKVLHKSYSMRMRMWHSFIRSPGCPIAHACLKVSTPYTYVQQDSHKRLCEVRLAPHHVLHVTSWGEPERAPHRRVAIYICVYYNILLCMVRPSPARRYIHCTQCAIYSGGRMKKLLRSTV